MIDLLPLGKEVIKLIDDIGNHKAAYSHLKKQIKTYFDISQDDITTFSKNQLHDKLERLGWKSDEVPKYHEWLTEVFHLEFYSYFAIFSALVARYASIIFQYDPDNFAKDILNELVMDALRGRLLVRSGGLLSEKVSHTTKEQMLHTLLSQLAGSTQAYFLNYAPPVQLNRFIQSATEDTVKSLYYILSPPKGYLKWTLERLAKIEQKVKYQLEYLESLD
jgi:hypothetical protein